MDGNNTLEIKQIMYKSDLYESELELRNKVLRLPLGLSIYTEDLTPEASQWHFGAFVKNQFAGVLVLVPHEQGEIKMRQVAVDEIYQHKHIGSQLVRYAEKFAAGRGFLRMVLHARQSAVPFYQKLGYKIVSDVFTEVTIPHYRMLKEIG